MSKRFRRCCPDFDLFVTSLLPAAVAAAAAAASFLESFVRFYPKDKMMPRSFFPLRTIISITMNEYLAWNM